MSPDLTSRSRGRTPRAPARFIAGLALVAVTAACGSGDNDVAPAGPTSAPAPTVTASAQVSPEPTSATTSSAEVTEASHKSTASKAGGLDGPYRLRIQRIGVDASVVPIQSDAQRILNPPRDPRIAGWWSDGAAPGEQHGSAVMVGHTVRNQGGGVFDHIGDLTRGDAIEVKGSNSTLTYRVKSIDVLSKGDFARDAQQIFAQTGAGRLVIITCDDWDGKVWRSNIVTIAAPG